MEKERILCDKDKAHYLVATVILIKDRKYLITKRAPFEKNWPNLWTVPGGKLELKDYINSPYDTENGKQWYNVIERVCKREVKEEVNLDIKNLKYLTSLAFIRPDGIPTIVMSMFADPASEEIKLCEALTEYAWVSLEEAKNYPLIDGIYEELEMLDKHLKGEELKEWKKA